VELGKIPLFGFFYKRTCILVDRGCSKSRLTVLMSQKRFDRGLSVCIFPEGGVPDDELILWMRCFRLAIEHQIPIVPISFQCKRDFLILFFSGGPGLMRVKIHKLKPLGKTGVDRRHIREEVRDVIYNQLVAYENEE
jgi:1-acyl-sn-glycerol-3-phosphate acyltransferase